MTDQTIIDDAKEAGFETGGCSCGRVNCKKMNHPDEVYDICEAYTLNECLTKFAQLRDARAKANASKQAQPVAIIKHKLAEDGKSGHVVWLVSPASMPEDTFLFTSLTQPTQMHIPDGYKLVPIEPTAKMSSFINTGVHWQVAERIYKAMLEAAPSIKGNTEGEK